MRDSPASTIRVVLVMRNLVSRRSLSLLLGQSPELCLVADVETTDEAIRIVRTAKPEVIVSGLRLPDVDPFRLVSSLEKQGLDIPVLILTAQQYPYEIMHGFSAGVAGYLLMDIHPDALVLAIRAARYGLTVLHKEARRVIQAGKSGRLMKPPEPDGSVWELTPREAQVLGLMAEGLRNKAIATRLGIGSRTVEVHVSHLVAKLGVTSRTEAMMVAVRSLAPP